MFKSLRKPFASSKNSKNVETDAVGLPPRPPPKQESNELNNSAMVPYIPRNNQQVAPHNDTQRIARNQIVGRSNQGPANIVSISQSQNVHFGNVINLSSSNRNTSNTAINPQKPVLKTETIQEMMNSTEEMSAKLLDTLAGNLGLRWKEFIMKMGISENQRDLMWIDHKDEGVKVV